jgi:DNA-binding transcriptional ArsR family regulator
MSIHIIPHGRVTEHIKRGLRGHSSVDQVHLLVSPRFLETSYDLAEELEVFGYEVNVHEISAFELRSVVDTIVTIAKEHLGEDLYVNITGGTNLMAGAATSSAFFIGASPYYVLEPQEDEPIEELIISLPAPRQPLTFDLSDSQREVLDQLGEWDANRKDGVIGREIGETLGESAQNVSYHIGKLEEKGLVETYPEGRRKEITLTDVGRLYLRWTGGVAG